MKVHLKPLDEQVILITGASSGIGRTTARLAAERGAKVVLVARDADALAEVVREIEAAGGTAAYTTADVGMEAEVEAAAAFAVERFGRIDTWVNDAGASVFGKLLEMPNDDHRRMMETNYWGAVHGCRAAVPRLIAAGGGALITVGSIGSDMPAPIMGAYTATKHAVKAYVSVLRMELYDAGAPVSVTLIKPAGVDTPIGRHTQNHEGGEAMIPPPIYTPDLVADAILFCATHQRRTITVGGGGKAQVLFAKALPWLFEAIAPKMANALFVDRRREQPPESNLYEGQGGPERSGEHLAKPFSLYTKASEHPAAAMLGMAAVGGLAAWLMTREREANAERDIAREARVNA